jgi:hypothetical protein
MKGLIDQAFLHVDVIGPHVYYCRYDLVTEEGAIVLPQLWEATVKPGCTLKMHMWPLPAPPPRPRPPPLRPSPPPQQPPAPERIVIIDSSDSESVDSRELISDSDIEDEAEDLGIEIDFDKEEEKAELSLGELLGKCTNATDILGDTLCSDDESDSGLSWISD